MLLNIPSKPSQVFSDMSNITTAGGAGKLPRVPSIAAVNVGSLTANVTVARIAYICSDVIISVQPALGLDSEFSQQLHVLASRNTAGVVSKEPEARQASIKTAGC